MAAEGTTPDASRLTPKGRATRERIVDAAARLMFERWEGAIREGLRAMHERGDLPADAGPDHLALAVLAALQGGLLLTQLRRDTAPLEAALDTVIDRIASLRRS